MTTIADCSRLILLDLGDLNHLVFYSDPLRHGTPTPPAFHGSDTTCWSRTPPTRQERTPASAWSPRRESNTKSKLTRWRTGYCYCRNRSTYDRLFLAFIAGSGLSPSPPRHDIQSAHTDYNSTQTACAEHAMARVLNRLGWSWPCTPKLMSTPNPTWLLLEQRLLDIMHKFS